MPTITCNINGSLVFSNRGGHKPSHVNPARLAEALRARGGERLVEHLPKPVSTGTAIDAACSRVTRLAREAGMKWHRMSERDAATGKVVVLLLAESEDVAAKEVATKRYGVVEIDPSTDDAQTGTAIPAVQPLLDKFVEAFRKELGCLDSASLWNAVTSLFAASRESLKVADGSLFVSGQAEQDMRWFDEALAEIGSHYRLLVLPFSPDVHGPIIARDARSELADEFTSVKAEYDAMMDKSNSSGRKVQERAIYRKVAELNTLEARCRLLAMVAQQDASDLANMASTLRAEAIAQL